MHWKIKEQSIWCSNGCGCCEPDKMESYVVEDEDGNLLGCEFEGEFMCYTYNSQREALEAILNKIGHDVEYTYEEENEDF